MSTYLCDRCGACCQGHLLVEVYHLDVLREPKLAEVPQTWSEGLTHNELLAELEYDDRCLLLAGSAPCPFHGSDGGCSIYSTRPNVSVAMQPGDDQCQAARKAAGLPPLEPAGPLLLRKSGDPDNARQPE